MVDMQHCRFRNIVGDLEDCLDHLLDDVSEEEATARIRLIDICSDIIEESDNLPE